MLLQRFRVLFWVSVVAASSLGACGGNVVTSGGAGGGSGAGHGGTGATGSGATGSGATGATGSGGSCTGGPCLPGAGCCQQGAQCTPGPDAVCRCYGGHWDCVGSGGGGGCAGGTGTCGPDGAPCCSEGMGCGTAGPGGFSCDCKGGRWWCNSSCDPSSCGPEGAPCCNEGSGCGHSLPGGGMVDCKCGGGTWSCTTTSPGDAGPGCPGGCGPGLVCCNSACVNPDNDIHNCGLCGKTCGGTHPYCDHGKCTSAPCGNQQMPPPGTFCCGNQFCKNSQLCCAVQLGGPVSPYPSCYAPTLEGTCPAGCPACL